MKTDNNTISKPPHGLPPLPLSQTETGALATAPLSTVISSATDDLYQDIYNLVHGEIKIVSVANNSSSAAAGTTDGGGDASALNSSSAVGGGVPESHAAASVEKELTAAALGITNEPSSSTNTTPTAPPTSSFNPKDAILETRKQRMSNLSFAQRRHELTRRIVQHTKSLAQVYALTASSLPKSHSAILQQKALKQQSSGIASPPSSFAKIHDPPPRLGATVQVSSDALQYVKSGWVSQDEAQDALYFHHDGLWKARGHCHDVLGALCVLSTPTTTKDEKDGRKIVVSGGGRWPDFPNDVALAVDRYETSNEKAYSASELQARLASVVRRKLVLGEIGEDRRKGSSQFAKKLPWRVILGKGGGCIRLTYGNPRTVSTAEALRQQSLAENNDTNDNGVTNLQQYPIEARLSVLSEDPSASWKLLSIQVQCSPKTGESDHQLVLNKKQMFDLHRIGERCMIVEEAVCRKANKELKKKKCIKDAGDDGDVVMGNEQTPTPSTSPIVPRPLYRLFEVCHAFALSIQMEILSSQAEALRRGAWGGSSSIKPGPSGGRVSARGQLDDECIQVSSVYFFDGQKGSTDNAIVSNDRDEPAPIAVMAVHFWSCDDRYGSPRVGDISTAEDGSNEKKEEKEASETSKAITSNHRRDDNYLPKSDRRGEKRLSLCIRAIPTIGLVVSLSGGSDVVIDKDSSSTASHHMQRNVDKLLSSIQDSFQLSMSDALLAATVLCAERRCQAVVTALNSEKTNTLPEWIQLEVECGTISVAAAISYPTASSPSPAPERTTVLFRLACDSRTGRFVPIFPRSASLLRLLACNDPSCSDIQSLHTAKVASMLGARSSTNVGGRNVAKRVDGASRESTGRIVRDAFDALSRSIDTLGRKCGVGGQWNDIDAQSASLREKSINQTCQDVRSSLMTCAGMSAVFGVGTIALKIVGGVNPAVDMAGGPIDTDSNSDLIRVPPLSVPLRQSIVEKEVKEGDGETKRISQLRAELFAVSAAVTKDRLNLVCFDVLTISESASSVPTRLEYVQVESPKEVEDDLSVRPSKRPRLNTKKDSAKRQHTLLDEVGYATSWVDTLLRQ